MKPLAAGMMHDSMTVPLGAVVADGMHLHSGRERRVSSNYAKGSPVKPMIGTIVAHAHRIHMRDLARVRSTSSPRRVKGLDRDPPLALDLAQPEASQSVVVVRSRGQAHGVYVVGLRIRGYGSLPRLPDAGGEIHPCHWVRRAVPVHDQLDILRISLRAGAHSYGDLLLHSARLLRGRACRQSIDLKKLS